MPFKMRCPRCQSFDYSSEGDNFGYRASPESFSLIFSCRCGRQLFGEQVVAEHDRQKKEYDANTEARRQEQSQREEAERHEKEQAAAYQRALEYRTAYLMQKRREAEEAAQRERDEADRRWRERLAQVGEDADDTPEHADGFDEDEDTEQCAWHGCTNARRPNSKYCSRACSNKNARYRYKQRRRTSPDDDDDEPTEHEAA